MNINFDLTKGLGRSKKCWYFTGFLSPSERVELAEAIGGIVTCDGRIIMPGEGSTRVVPQSTEREPEDLSREDSHAFSPGA